MSVYIHIHGGSDGKETACNAEHPGSILGSGRSPREGNGHAFQHSCLENSMDRWAWWATVHGVAKSLTQLKDFHFTLYIHAYVYYQPPQKLQIFLHVCVCVYTHTHTTQKLYLAWKYDCSKSAIDAQITFCTVREFIKTEAKVSLSDLLKHEVMILRMSCICHLCDAETLCIKADHPNL